MLFPMLTPTHVATNEVTDTVVIGGVHSSRSDIVGAATATAERIGGASRLVVEATPTIDTVIAIVGALFAGVIVIPVAPDAGASERRHIVDDSGAQAWLGATPADKAGLPHLPIRRYARSWHSHPRPGPTHPAMIMYTSGTTGAPKGVVSTHGSIAAGLDGLAQSWQWTADDVVVHGLPLFHVHGLILGILGPLRRGGRVIHTGKPTPQAYANAPGTMYFGVPTVWSRVIDDPDSARELSAARLLISGSAPLSPSVFNRLHELTGIAPIERYGMTETLITLSTRADGERRAGWVGLPIDGVESRIVDDSGEELARDGESIGQLQVRGSMIGLEYLNHPEATAKSWLDGGWFATGDAAVIDADGMHRIIGRMSTDIIKSGGYRIGTGEIEECLLGHPRVWEVAVIGVPDDDLGQRLAAFVVATDVDDRLAGELMEFVGQQLSGHKRPREIRFIDELPRNAMGKVRKAALLD